MFLLLRCLFLLEPNRNLVRILSKCEHFHNFFASGVNDTADNILRAIDVGAAEIAPSTVFAVAAILEGCTFINGSPQNTLVPGVGQVTIV